MAFESAERPMDTSWGDSHPQVQDEFTCSTALRGALLNLQPTVKRVFGVELDIAVEEVAEAHQNGLMWLQLKGTRDDVQAAKLFVRGVVNQEEQQEVLYPEVLHCVFCGARGLFMDCLIRNTSAHIVVGSPGCVLISGLAEPAVRAYSLIVDLMERYEASQGRRMDAGARGAGESLDSRRAFKALVERWDDRHTLDLLVLPATVKEVLLELVRDSRWGSTPTSTLTAEAPALSPWTDLDTPSAGLGATALDRQSYTIPELHADHRHHQHIPGGSNNTTHSPLPSQSNTSMEAGAQSQPQGPVLPATSPGVAPSAAAPLDPFTRGLVAVDGAHPALGPTEVTNVVDNRDPGLQGAQPPEWMRSIPQEDSDIDIIVDEDDDVVEVSPVTTGVPVGGGGGGNGRQDDVSLLLKFFTAMGFREEAVRRVIARTGPRDACEILELVQQEQDREQAQGDMEVVVEEEWEERMKDEEEEEEEVDTTRNKNHTSSSRRSGGGAEGASGLKGRLEERGGATLRSHIAAGSMADSRAGEGGIRRSTSRQEQEKEENKKVEEEEKEKEDFVLGVVKKAAASCGYTEEQVQEVCSNMPEVSLHQVVLELQRQTGKDGKPHGTNATGAAAAVNSTSGSVSGCDVAQKGQQRPQESLDVLDGVVNEEERRRRRRQEEELEDEKKRNATKDVKDRTVVGTRQTERGGDYQGTTVGTVRPQPTKDPTSQNAPRPFSEHTAIERYLIDQAYSEKTHEVSPHTERTTATNKQQGGFQPFQPPGTEAAGKTKPTNWSTMGHLSQPRAPNPAPIRGPPRPLYPHETLMPMPGPAQASVPTRPHLRQNARPPTATAAGAGPIVTGQRRFLESLQKPFQLELADEPGDPSLRQVIIDASNVAMSHGLGQFFSCRGIALAVQHFWDRGHRQISALLPQWREKRDPKVKEQQYLTQLNGLGLLSYTPSREVQGKRINSYDDRFMLQLAQKTGGVIVTNDNMRDLFDESYQWKDIIRKSLLQYTFVGDLFMVPDDPLGRDGPHLNDFLRSQPRSATNNSHTFSSSYSNQNQHQRFQSEQLQFRDRTLGGSRAAAPEEFQSDHTADLWGWELVRPGGGSKGPKGRGDGGPGGVTGAKKKQQQRSVEETCRLRESLSQVFPGQAGAVASALTNHPTLRDVNMLSHFILEQQTAGD